MSEPKTLLEAVRHFSNLNVCHEYMLALKWPDGKILCPKCASESIGRIATRRMLKCRACGKQFSAKVGTILRTRRSDSISGSLPCDRQRQEWNQ